MRAKIAVYNLREDERAFFDAAAQRLNAEIVGIPEGATPETLALAQGCNCISITSDNRITAQMLADYRAMGIRLLSTRTIGVDHIDLEAARAQNIEVANVTYSASSVADYTIMLMLMVLRKAKHIMTRSLGQDYTISRVRGRELPELTVGVIGAGRIGSTVIRHLTGFGCRVLFSNRTPRPELEGMAEYVSLDTLLAESDVVTLHIPLTADTKHFMNRTRLEQMKKDSILINTSRGALVDSAALIDALESGSLWGAGLDVIEGDLEIYYRDMKDVVIPHREMAILNAMPNVLVLPHLAFYTDTAVRDMVDHSVESCAARFAGEADEA